MAFNLTPQAVLGNLASASSLLSRLTNVDVVQVLDQETNRQIFRDARPVKAEVRETARVMKYPVETGATLADHKVIEPTEIRFVVMISAEYWSSVYQEIRNAWMKSTLLSVQTRTGTYLNMIISAMPHEEDPEMADVVTLLINFEEVIMFTQASLSQSNRLQNFKPAEPRHSSLVNRGLIASVATTSSIYGYYRALSVWGR